MLRISTYARRKPSDSQNPTAGVPPTASTPREERPSEYARRARHPTSARPTPWWRAAGWTITSTTPMSPMISRFAWPMVRPGMGAGPGPPAESSVIQQIRRSPCMVSVRYGVIASGCHGGSSGRSAASTSFSVATSDSISSVGAVFGYSRTLTRTACLPDRRYGRVDAKGVTSHTATTP